MSAARRDAASDDDDGGGGGGELLPSWAPAAISTGPGKARPSRLQKKGPPRCQLHEQDEESYRYALLHCQNQQAARKTRASVADLDAYYSYEAGGTCPDDWKLVQKLIFKKDCFELQKRRCLARVPEAYVEPLPLPESLWTLPDNKNVHWADYDCDSFQCLVDRKRGDCLSCFNLTQLPAQRVPIEQEYLMECVNGPIVMTPCVKQEHKDRWEGGFVNEQFTMEQVLQHKPHGIRIGLDVGGGTGTFAANMRERGITIVTTGMNSGAPFLETIALRGLPALHLPHKQRLPFFDGTLDLIHQMHSVHELPQPELKLLLLDWDRILRPGGLLWIDNYYKSKQEMPSFLAVFEMLSYVKLEWRVFDKTSATFAAEEQYFSAVLEKPHKQ
eukprot:SM000119S25639  [mRNA]  locus=s119:147678:150443:+ [translate_table: standard]